MKIDLQELYKTLYRYDHIKIEMSLGFNAELVIRLYCILPERIKIASEFVYNSEFAKEDGSFEYYFNEQVKSIDKEYNRLTQQKSR